MPERLLQHLHSVAPDHVDIPILQPADPFLETAGEDLRRRIFITQSNAGDVQCLRPEFTIPICIAHVESERPQARYAYGGTVFRQQRDGALEFLQVGLEDLGDDNRADADATSIADMLATLGHAGIRDPKLTLGDQSLFAVVVENLQLPDTIARRLVRNFGSPNALEGLLNRLSTGRVFGASEDEADKLAAAGHEAALIEHVESLMQAANIAPASGRSPKDIAQRLIDKAGEGSFKLDQVSAETLRQFLAIELPLTHTPDALAAFSAETGIQFREAGSAFEGRITALVKKGAPLENMTYRASFGRNLEYYTGVLFEAAANGKAVAGGGRYDRLCSLLGADTPVPAVGFSLALDRVEAAL